MVHSRQKLRRDFGELRIRMLAFCGALTRIDVTQRSCDSCIFMAGPIQEIAKVGADATELIFGIPTHSCTAVAISIVAKSLPLKSSGEFKLFARA